MDKDDKLLDHEYDGIQELDNNLPLWWLWTFFGAIIFSFIYWIHYSFLKEGPNLDQELQAGMEQVQAMRDKPADGSDKKSEMSEEQILAMGAKIFKANCASCHKEDGGGSIGPNLTDKFWIHGANMEAIVKVVSKGVLDKGMPPWENILRPNEVKAVSQYVLSMNNTNVAGGKGPQGEAVE